MEHRLKPKAEQILKTRAEELDLLVPIREAEIHLLRSSMFTAQAIIRDMEKAGREEEIEQISRNISEVAPDLPGKSVKELRD